MRGTDCGSGRGLPRVGLAPTASLHVRGAQRGESRCLCKSLQRVEVGKGVSSPRAVAQTTSGGTGTVLTASTALLWSSVPIPAVPEQGRLSTCPICPPAGWEPLLEGVRKNPSISEKMHLQKAVVAWFVTSRRQSLSWFCCEGCGNGEKELVSPPAMSWAMSLYPQTFFFLPGF